MIFYSMNEVSFCGLANPIKNDNNEWTGKFASRNPNKPAIEINDIYIDASSHTFDPKKDYVGLIIYLHRGVSDFTFNNVHCRTGDIYIKETKWIEENVRERNGRGNYYHGRLFYSIFDCWKKKKLEFVVGGFSYRDGQWKFNSGTLNTMNPDNNDDGYHNTDRKLDGFEKQLIQGVCSKLYTNHQWKKMSSKARVSFEYLLGIPLRRYANRKFYGTVKWVNYRKGYGFIESLDFDDDIFVHCSEVLDLPTNGHFLTKNDDVEFNVIKGDEGWEAENVTVIDSD
jgi:CspA family cold shock protein